jgi:PAS domain S-box-containing protein
MVNFVGKSQLQMEGKEGIEALFLYATEGILVVDEKGVILRINPSAEKLFGYEKNELIGKKVEELVPRRLAGSHHEHRDKFNENPRPRAMGLGMELYGARKDGSEIPVEISLSPYTSEEGKFTIAFIVDITHRKQAEEKMKNYSQDLEKQVKNRTLILEEAIQELEKTKRNLNEALEKEKELNELKSRFVSMASHEFRTPLATIQSSLSLVKKYGDIKQPEKQDQHINKIKSSISNLTDILNDFLSVSKLEEGKVENFPEKFNLKNFVLEVCSEMEGIAKKDQKIIYNHTGNENAVLDQKLLKNILFNLISNAIKFCPEAAQIKVETEMSDSQIIIRVKDQGIGIPKEDQKHLFQRFFRGHNVTHIQGTGLGLNIVSKYVELMDGVISLTSLENTGTTFTITIPQ